VTKFSANLGFLWKDKALPDAVRAAKVAGFDAVECHWPYATRTDDLNLALSDTNLIMLGLNTRPGDIKAGEFGLSALPARMPDAQAVIFEALDYAKAVSTSNIHVMAGIAAGEEAHDTFVENLKFACDLATKDGQTILIEPLNGYDVPGYFLKSNNQAAAIIEEVNAPNLRLMFDCYHVGRMGENVLEQLERLLPIVGHIQFASVPDRGPPDRGDIDYSVVFKHLEQLGYERPLGAEFKPEGEPDVAALKALTRT